MEQSPTTTRLERVAAAAAVAILLVVGAVNPVFGQGGAAQQPAPTPAPAPQPMVPGTFGFGRPATAADIAAIDIDVRPDGAGLAAGSGTAVQGLPIFAEKCSGCHGSNGEGTSAGPKLIDPTPFRTGVTAPTVGNYWPYSTTVWDYINRAMPFDRPGSLSADEVYSLTAYLLASNHIIGDADVMDAQSLPKVKMPNASGFESPDPRPDVP
jgi:mono/diheme cytochrome c family protein